MMNQISARPEKCSANNIKLLLVEDDMDVGDSLAKMLNGKGYEVSLVRDGEQGLSVAMSADHDLILLDKLLPKLDGLSVLQQLRSKKDTPVIMLTACGTEQDRIDGFRGGADDYLPKPFNVVELELRIEALLRRSKPSTNMGTHSISDGELVLDTHQLKASYRGRDVALTPIEYQLLEVLMGHRDEVLSKPYLSQSVLNKPLGRYDRSLDMHVSNLRSKLASVIPDRSLIKTVHGKGYRYQ